MEASQLESLIKKSISLSFFFPGAHLFENISVLIHWTFFSSCLLKFTLLSRLSQRSIFQRCQFFRK